MKHDPLPQAAAAESAAPGTTADPLTDFTPVSLRRSRHDGWTAARQRIFLGTLADTGSISRACQAAGMTARSAYRLRRHPDAHSFAHAWDHALFVATTTLTTLAFERATRGAIREYWKDGALVAETREPSDGLLKWLLAHLVREKFGSTDKLFIGSPATASRKAFPQMLDALTDSDMPADPLSAADFRAAPPDHAHDPIEPPSDPDAEDDEWDEAWDEEAEDDPEDG